ncbi:MAG: hypothetical protein WC614_05980 [bacterium]
MSYFDDAKSLVEHASNQFSEIRSIYEQSLHEKSIKSELSIEIKNLMENLRSALDFTAHGLFSKYGDKTKSNLKIYFPYATENQSRLDFQNQNRIERCIYGLNVSRPDIVKRIESYQHFSDPNNIWLPQFMDLCNENKHQQLTPQERREVKQLKLTSGGTNISLVEGASISMDSGTQIQMGGMIIPGDQRFDVNNPPVTVGSGKKEIITWVSFHFSSNNQPVIPFLEQCVNGVRKIVEETSKL